MPRNSLMFLTIVAVLLALSYSHAALVNNLNGMYH